MKTAFALAAVTAAIAFAATAGAQDAKTEKCYGVVKAGKNDCQTATSSCAGTSRKDAQADARISVPVGVCAKIVGGSTTPRKG